MASSSLESPGGGSAPAMPVRITTRVDPRPPLIGKVIGKRWHLVEFHELDIFPTSWRNYVTDILSFCWQLDPADLVPAPLVPTVVGLQPLVPLLTPPTVIVAEILDNALRRAKQTTIVDLCSGGSGPIPKLSRELAKRRPQKEQAVRFLLTDLYPNIPAFENASRGNPGVDFHRQPVNALACKVPGFRTLFGSFHHFDKRNARSLLQDAVHNNQGIAVFEFSGRSLGFILTLLFLTVALALIATPFLRPFSWRRLFYTYIVPVVPAILVIDGFTSCLRTYSVDEAKELIRSLKGADRFEWEVVNRNLLTPFTYLTYIVGVPVAPSATPAA